MRPMLESGSVQAPEGRHGEDHEVHTEGLVIAAARICWHAGAQQRA
jgi:hypothetical protein